MMKAIHISSPGALSLVEVEERPLQQGEAKVRIRAAGVCAGDISAYLGYNVTIRYPRILGHEAVGEIMEICGESNLKPGDRVAIEPFLPCGSCHPCNTGRHNNCKHLRVLGVHIDGAMVETINHPLSHLVPIPSELDWELSLLAEPMAIAVHALKRAHAAAGQWIAISGAGSIGMLCAIACRDLGAYPVLLDPIPEKRALAAKLGFAHVVDAAAPDAIQQVLDAAGQAGISAVLECSGAQSGLNAALEYVEHSGYVVVVGWPKGNVTLDLAKVIVKELHMDGSRNSYGEFPEAMEILSRNKEAASRLITNVHGLEHLPAAMEDFAAHPQTYIKLMTTL